MKRFIQPFFLMLAFFVLIACKKKSSGVIPPPGGGVPVVVPPVILDTNEIRGVWITTAASNVLDSRASIRQAVQICKASHINHIFMVTYNNGRTIYPSPIMNALIGKPIAERFDGRDPLREIIEESHAVGIKVHAWFEYGFSSSFSANGGLIVAAKPNWAAKDVNGNLVVKNGFDWLNAFDPEVQNFMISLFKEVVERYNIDGVQGDDRLPAVPSTAGYDPYTVAMYKSEHGGANPPVNAFNNSWVTWRAKKLNQFLKRLRTEVKTMKPNIMFSMSPSVYPFSLTEYLQDWPTWVDSGYVDVVIPQCYRYDIAAYNATLTSQKNLHRNPAVKFYPGVLLKVGPNLASDAYLTQMLQANRAAGYKGEVFFFYEGIKDKQNYFIGQYPTIK